MPFRCEVRVSVSVRVCLKRGLQCVCAGVSEERTAVCCVSGGVGGFRGPSEEPWEMMTFSGQH